MPRRSDWRLCAGSQAVPNRVPPTFDPRMDLESCPLFGRVVGRSPQPYHQVERILPAAGPSLFTIHSGMMNEEDGNSLPPESQEPVLHGQPRIDGSFAPVVMSVERLSRMRRSTPSR